MRFCNQFHGLVQFMHHSTAKVHLRNISACNYCNLKPKVKCSTLCNNYNNKYNNNLYITIIIMMIITLGYLNNNNIPREGGRAWGYFLYKEDMKHEKMKQMLRSVKFLPYFRLNSKPCKYHLMMIFCPHHLLFT